MLGLDTNILLRYIVQDDVTQARKATRLIESRRRQGSRFYLTQIVMCELVWVLETSYGYQRDMIASVLDKILRTRQFDFQSRDIMWQALDDYRAGNADFADYLIGRVCRNAGCQHTVSFDRALKNTCGFERL